jgi:glycosyltransferase involved in cell wall biosynthesis
MISMFKNEAKNIRRMLDSVAPYISYWVLQDNGSTDGTPEIVDEWANEVKIPGFLYKVEEGWVNFGWNRDHLLQSARNLQETHNCQWIMKMDCDESLEVDSDFDWSPFFEDHQSFHVTAIAPGIIYNRAWIWNTKYPWSFNHDPAHETIKMDVEGIGENFQRTNLSKSFRMVSDGKHYGESYELPTKYITDALKLEEKLIRENTMLTDLYHFWYVGKSYEDCYRGDFYPLKKEHQQEYAKRCIFYFENFVNVTHNYNETQKPDRMDEMAYFAMCSIGNAYKFLGEDKKAIEYFCRAEPFCPRRNDHLVYLAELYNLNRDYVNMHKVTSVLMQPERTNPFPEYMFIINTNMYHDTGDYIQQLHKTAESNLNSITYENLFQVKYNQTPRVFVVDDFYENPDMIRQFALSTKYEYSEWYKGQRSVDRFLSPQIKKRFEEIIGQKIIRWEEHGQNGKFAFCTPEDPVVYHYDNQKWAGMIYLTPNAPYDTGTTLHAHKATGIREADHPNSDECFKGGFFDGTKFDLVDSIGNIYNRLVIFNARSFHAAHRYFGTNIENGRLFHLFFFD